MNLTRQSFFYDLSYDQLKNYSFDVVYAIRRGVLYSVDIPIAVLILGPFLREYYYHNDSKGGIYET